MKLFLRSTFIAFFLFHASAILKAQCLSGTYQIGGTGSTFNSFQSAADTLKKYGVCGPVVLNVSPGTYTEQVSLSAIAGVSATNTIRFVSMGSQISDVKLTSASSSSATNNYTLQLDGVDYISFENMTINRSGNLAYGYVIDIRNGADYITFKGNEISSEKYNMGNSNLIYSPNTIDNYLTLTNNTFRKGEYPVYGSGTSTSLRETGLIIKNNTFIDQSSGVNVGYTSDVEISGNTFNSAISSMYYYAFNLYGVSGGFSFTSNKFGTTGTVLSGSALRLYNCTSSSALVANNMINMIGSSNPLYFSDCTNLSVLFNTIRNTSGPGIYISGNSSLTLKNNILYVYSNYIQLVSPSSLTESNYNDLYAMAAGTSALYYGTNCNSFASWVTRSGKDVNSLSTVPKFISTIDLHLNKDDNLDDKAMYSSLVTTDIDGEPRDLVHPDIGADETTLSPNDISFVSLFNPDKSACTGTEAIQVIVKNRGSNVLTSFDVYASRDNVSYPVYNWTGNLAKGAYDTITVGSTYFATGQSYAFRAWVANPNHTTDTNKDNDSSTVLTVHTRMQGTYTIGGVNPSYATFASAASALQTKGICGPVTFQVRTGTYQESFTLYSVKGASAASKIIFQAENGDSTSVRLIPPSNGGTALTLSGARHVIFQKITLSASSGNAYANAVYLNNCANVRFYNTVIHGNYADAVATNYFNDSLYFINNNLDGGLSSLNLGWSRAWIKNNTFGNNTSYGIIFTSGKQVVIDGNTFYLTSSNGYSAIKGGFYDTTFITNNNITLVNGGTGIDMAALQYAHISNNFLKIGGTNGGYGISSAGSGIKKIFYNTVWVSNTDPGSVALSFGGSPGSEVKNNILYNSGGGFAISASNATGVISDYNNLYTTGTKLGYYTYTNLAAWQSGTGRDAHSISVVPVFLSANDLHSALSSPVGGKGIQVPDVFLDADGDNRKSTPDIGADEFFNLNIDAGVVKINKPSPTCTGIPDVRVIIKNYTSDTLRHATIGWSVNSISQTPYAWSGKIAPGDTSQWIALGKYLFPYATSSVVKCWTSYQGDLNHANDTLQTAPFTERMGGTYFIGKQNAHFTTIGAAINAVNSMGVCQPVIFKIRDGVYEESVTIYQVPGSNGTNTVTFTSESGDSSKVVIVNNSSAATLRISGASNLIFSRLSIVQNYIYYGAKSVELTNNCHHLRFENNYIVQPVVTNSSSDHHLSFTKNYLYNGGINLTASGVKAKGNTIAENSFRSTAQDAIIAGYQDSLEIRANVLLPDIIAYTLGAHATSSDSNYITGTIITINNCGPAVNVYNNKLNTLYNCFCYPTVSAIKVNNCSGTSANPIMVYNNFISLAESYVSFGSAAGIEHANSSYVNYFHNSVSINIQSGHEDGHMCFMLRSGSNIRLENNQLVSYKDGFAIYTYADKSAFTTCDYNNLYIVHTTGAKHIAGESNGTRYTDFSDWQQTGLDAHSLHADPHYKALLPGYKNYADLHLDPNSPTVMQVPHYVGVTKDIDGQTRSTVSPVIGADEYTRPANNAQALHFDPATLTPCAGASDVIVKIANYGSSTLSSVTINWTVNGVSQVPYNWSGSLNPQDSISVTIAQYTFVSNVAVTLQAETVNPNGMPDEFPQFDTTQKIIVSPALHGVYTIGGSNADYPSFTAAINDLKKLGVCGSTTFNVRPGTYFEQLRIPSIKGSSATNSITFQSESHDSTSVRLTRMYANNYYVTDINYLLYLDGTDYISFRGMTFSATQGPYCRIVFIANESNHIEFTNNFIQSSSTDQFAGYFYYNDAVHIGGDYQENNLNNSIRFSYNRIEGGAAGISVIGRTPGDYYNLSNGLDISYNTFYNQSSYTLNIMHTEAPLITHNTFFQSDGAALYMGETMGQARVMYNDIDLGNRINAYSQAFYIVNHKSATADDAALVANNIVNIRDGYMPAATVRLETNKNVKILYNTFTVGQPSNNFSSAPVLTSNTDTSLVIMNNIFHHRAGGLAASFGGNVDLQTDYNLMYANGAPLIADNNTTYNTPSIYAYATGKEKHSVAASPMFVNAPNDLRLSPASPALGKGIARTEVIQDKDGRTRGILPSMGAYEGTVTLHTDAALVDFKSQGTSLCSSLKTITVVLKNFGLDTLKSATVHWSANGADQPTINWTGSLEPSASDTVVLGNYSFTPGNNKVYAALFNPNTLQDEYAINDTLTLQLYNTAIAIPDFTYTILWDGIVQFANASSGGTSFAWNFGDGQSSQEESPIYTFAEGTYTVVLTVTNACGSAQVQKTISILPTENKNSLSQQVNLYPNPSQGTVDLTWNNLDFSQLKITSALGKTVHTALLSPGMRNMTLHLEQVPSGIYLLELKSENQSLNYRLVIEK